jgi:hypothetical protein
VALVPVPACGRYIPALLGAFGHIRMKMRPDYKVKSMAQFSISSSWNPWIKPNSIFYKFFKNNCK